MHIVLSLQMLSVHSQQDQLCNSNMSCVSIVSCASEASCISDVSGMQFI